MDPEPHALPEACLKTRNLFARALEDPSAESELLGHANGCLDCMDAFLELKDTVRRLEQAAASLPDSREFSSRVFDAIDLEQKRRARRRTLLGALFVAGTLVVAGALAGAGWLLRDWRDARRPGIPQNWDGDRDTRAVPSPPKDPAGPSEPAPTPSEKGEASRSEPEPVEAPPPAEKAEEPSYPAGPEEVLEELLDAVRKAVQAPPRRPGGRKGAFFQNLRPIMARIALLNREDRELLVARMEKEKPGTVGPGGERFWEELIRRIKSMPDKGFRRQHPGGPPREEGD